MKPRNLKVSFKLHNSTGLKLHSTDLFGRLDLCKKVSAATLQIFHF
jgi:hypothetical protein